jgi:hypothetical protein
MFQFDSLDMPEEPRVSIVATEYGFLPGEIGFRLLAVNAAQLERDTEFGRRAQAELDASDPGQFAYRRVAVGCWQSWDGRRVASSWPWAPKRWICDADTELDDEGLAHQHLLNLHPDPKEGS